VLVSRGPTRQVLPLVSGKEASRATSESSLNNKRPPTYEITCMVGGLALRALCFVGGIRRGYGDAYRFRRATLLRRTCEVPTTP